MASKAPRVSSYQRRQGRLLRRRDRRQASTRLTLSGMLSVIPSLSRAELDRLVQQMIDRMDDMDGDTDLEPDGDELDGSMAEDDFGPQNADWLGYPGCPISDPGEDDTEDRCMAGDDGCAPVWLNGVQHWGYGCTIE